MTLKDKIVQYADLYFEDVRSYRRHLHEHPELSMQEKQTSLFIIDKLKEFNIPFQTFTKHYGVLGVIEGKNPTKKVIALRADMDALPINEENECTYKSKKHGVMHACGHDVHTASLLGVARIISLLKDDFEGTIKLIFQPSEETYPGGALMMIEDGILENPKVDLIIGQHVLPTIDAGKVGFKKGMCMASTDEIYITIEGKGGHAATPELNVDCIAIGAQIITALQQIVSRKAAPQVPTVLSFGRFIADGKVNIIPDKAFLEGTFRTFNEDWREQAHKLIRDIAEGIAQSMNAHAIVRIEKGYPFLINNDVFTEKCIEYATDLLGSQNIINMDVRMTAEDFAYFSQKIPACFYRLGVRNNSKNINNNLHTSTFDIDEDVLKSSIALMSWIALKELINED